MNIKSKLTNDLQKLADIYACIDDAYLQNAIERAEQTLLIDYGKTYADILKEKSEIFLENTNQQNKSHERKRFTSR